MEASSSGESDMRPHVLLVEDTVMQRIDLTEMLESANFRVIAVMTAEEALEVLRTVPNIQAIVTDVKLASEGMSGFELAQKVRSDWNIGAVVISAQVPPSEEDLSSGVRFLAKPVHEATLIHLVRSVMAEPAPAPSTKASAAMAPEPDTARELTPRQKDVLELLVQGKSNRDIAEALGLSEHTIKVHLAAIFRALRVSSRLEAVLIGMKRLQPDKSPHAASPPQRCRIVLCWNWAA